MVYRRRLQKARQERFAKSLEEVRAILDDAIKLVDSGHAHTRYRLGELEDKLAIVFRQAERLEMES